MNALTKAIERYASELAAVIVEPVAGNMGVVLPQEGFLKKLRELTAKNGIVLIFDEVITGFGRLGSPFGTSFFGVQPDMITMAKGLTNGAVPMGAVAASDQIYDAFMQGPEGAIELFHGYTYSAHPVACAAALGAIEEMRDGAGVSIAAALELGLSTSLRASVIVCGV